MSDIFSDRTVRAKIFLKSTLNETECPQDFWSLFVPHSIQQNVKQLLPATAAAATVDVDKIREKSSIRNVGPVKR